MFSYFLLIIVLSVFVEIDIATEVNIGPCSFQYLEPCSSDIISFYIFSSERPLHEPIALTTIDPKIPDWIDLSRKTKIIVHGYAGGLDFNATRNIRNAYLTQNNTNVIVVDWGKLVTLPCYPSASFNTKQAGECISTFVIELHSMNEGFQIQNIHGIGFSLGAHAISFASNNVEKLLGRRFGRITGLDPALPFFSTTDYNWKLDSEDADFVDIIHTNAGIFGKIERCGHVDFYVNGGKFQPGCDEHKNRPLCSHMLSTAYFTESIVSDAKFWGFQCKNYFMYLFGLCSNEDEGRNQSHDIAVMGEPCNRLFSGVYYVKTNKIPPYVISPNNLSRTKENTKLIFISTNKTI